MNVSASSPPSAAPFAPWAAWSAACGAAAFVAAYFGLLPGRSLTFDEAYSVHVVRHGLADLISFVAARDAHPPLFYVLLKGWTTFFGDTPTALRAFAAVGGAFMAATTVLLASTVVAPRRAVLAGFLAALAPIAAYTAAETRMYSWLAGVYALAARQAWLESDSARARPSALLVALFVALAYMHYLGALCVAAIVAASILVGDRRDVQRTFLAACLAGLAFAPWVPMLVQHAVDGRANPPWRPPLPATFPLEIVQVMTYGGGALRTAGYYTVAAASAAAQIAITAPLLLFWALSLRSLRRTSPVLTVRVACCVVAPALPVLAVSVATGSFIAYPRYFVYALPFLAIAAAAYLHDTGASYRGTRVLRQLLLVFIVALSIASVDGYLRHPSRGAGDWQSAAAFLTERRRAGEVVAVVPHYATIPFAYYSPNLASTSVAVRATWQDPRGVAAAADIDRLAASHDVVWVVGGFPLPPGSFEATYHRLAGTHTITEFGDFDNIRVTKFVRRGGAPPTRK